MWGSWMLSMMVLFLFHLDSMGLAAASTDVRAFSVHMMPAFAIDNVCCSCQKRDVRGVFDLMNYNINEKSPLFIINFSEL